jgi:hypothetical protein
MAQRSWCAPRPPSHPRTVSHCLLKLTSVSHLPAWAKRCWDAEVVTVNWVPTGDSPTARVAICQSCYNREQYRKRKEALLAASSAQLDTKAKGV